MEDPQNRLAKRNVALALLSKGTLYVHLDPRIKDVVVPAWLQHQCQLVLQFGYNMTIPIPDLCVDDQGVRGTLSFSRTPFHCDMPWDSVFALVGDQGDGMIWDDSMPPEIAAEIECEASKAASRTAVKPKPPPPPPSKAKPSRVKLPPYLRVIK